MPDDVQLRIASGLLGHLLGQHSTRQLSDRMEDIQHCLDVAAELMRRRGSDFPTGQAYSPVPTPPNMRVRKVVTDRDALPVIPPNLEQWRATRARKNFPEPSTSGRKKPTMH